MSIFDRYLLRMFTKVLAVSFLSLTGLFIIIDLRNVWSCSTAARVDWAAGAVGHGAEPEAVEKGPGGASCGLSWPGSGRRRGQE